MKVRLVAYRKADTDSNSNTAYELDLENQPNISLNLQFADIQEPAKRKGGFSQTFKLPFSKTNDTFFQTWYNVNFDSTIFDTRVRFPAVLFVGTIPQFEGFIQLKSVYLKAKLYEITIIGTTSNLFTNIGNKKLQDILVNDDGTQSNRYNHILNYANIEASWNGLSSSFTNVDGVSLRDTVGNVQKVMYPFSVTDTNFKFRAGSNEYLDMSQDDIDNTALYPNVEDSVEKAVNITNLRPAIQVKEIFSSIIAKAGFSYTSSYLSSEYFSRIFMTTAGHVTYARPPIVGWGGENTNQCCVGSSTGKQINYSVQYDSEGDPISLGECTNADVGINFGGYNWLTIVGDVVNPINSDFDIPLDPLNLWSETTTPNFFTKTDQNMNDVKISFIFDTNGIMTCGWEQSGGTMSDTWNTCMVWVGAFYLESDGTVDIENPIDTEWIEVDIPQSGQVDNQLLNFNLWLGGDDGSELGGAPIGSKIVFKVRCTDWERKVDPDGTPYAVNIKFGNLDGNINNEYLGGQMILIKMGWIGYGANVYGRQIDMYEALGFDMKQKDFMKDMIERFNLVIVSDPSDPDNLIIEPYTEYIGSGDIKDWTNKLDLSKERIVKDTTSLQKRDILMNDLEDVDLMNKAIKEETQHLNVYGHIDITVNNNDFANGEYKNNPVFSPYVNQKVFQGEDDQEITHIFNMPVQYEWTTTKVEGGYEKVLEQTKPKLFYYCGRTGVIDTKVVDSSEFNSGKRIYMHEIPAGGTPIAHSFTRFPLCTPFELQPELDPTEDDVGECQIVPITRSLYWNQNGPVCGNLKTFKWNATSAIPVKSIYYTYWFQYFNTIYHPDSRLMECYLNLTPSDMLNFKFSDQIFIKDSYWLVQKIQNYQVGQNVSTKVTLLKQDEVYASVCAFADYVVGTVGDSNGNESNLYLNTVYYWCPKEDPNCTPSVSVDDNYSGVMTDEASCECLGGKFILALPDPVSGFTPPFAGAGTCKPNNNSPNLRTSNKINNRSIYSNTREKSILSGRLGGLKSPFTIGTDTGRHSRPLVPQNANDIVIKYKNTYNRALNVRGESHKIILSGTTTDDTPSYAYAEGDPKRSNIIMPKGTNMIMKVKVLSTVVGGTSTIAKLGSTEALTYFTAFNCLNVVDQIGATGGDRTNYIMNTPSVQTALQILPNNNQIEFKLVGDANTTRVWQLTVEYEINSIPSLDQGYGNNYAQFQNGNNIQLENFSYLIWN